MKIYLSASNQTDNMYNTQAKMTECDVCYLNARKTQDYLSSIDGIECKLGSKHDTMVNKVKASNDFKADYHVCIHTNAGGGKGTEVYIAPKNINDVIIFLNGADRPKKDILIDLERVMRPQTDKEKSLIIKTYELWRNNYMKCEV